MDVIKHVGRALWAQTVRSARRWDTDPSQVAVWIEAGPNDAELTRFIPDARAALDAILPAIKSLSRPVVGTPYEQGWNHALGKVVEMLQPSRLPERSE